MTDPDNRPEHLSFDAAADRYEADSEFLWNALDAVGDAKDLPATLIAEITKWYRTTESYAESVQFVIEEAEKP